MSLGKRLEGIFFNPRAVFEALAARPVWVDALILTLVVFIAFNVVLSPTMQKDQLRIWKDNAALKERMGEEAYNRMIQRLENPSPVSRIIQNFVATPLFYLAATLLQALVLLLLGRFLSSQGTYVQVFAALLHAGWIDKLLGNVVRLVLALSRQSVMQTSTGLALFFPKLEVTSTPYIFLAQVDIFQIWMFGVLGLGLAAIFKVKLQKALALSYGLWFLKALANIGLGLIGTSFLR